MLIDNVSGVTKWVKYIADNFVFFFKKNEIQQLASRSPGFSEGAQLSSK